MRTVPVPGAVTVSSRSFLLCGNVLNDAMFPVADAEMTNPYVPMADPAALGLALAPGGAVTSDGKALSSSDPQYTAQYNPNDYMNNDQYNQYYSTQYNQGADAYQTTTEFNANEYAYDQEQVWILTSCRAAHLGLHNVYL